MLASGRRAATFRQEPTGSLRSEATGLRRLISAHRPALRRGGGGSVAPTRRRRGENPGRRPDPTAARRPEPQCERLGQSAEAAPGQDTPLLQGTTTAGTAPPASSDRARCNWIELLVRRHTEPDWLRSETALGTGVPQVGPRLRGASLRTTYLCGYTHSTVVRCLSSRRRQGGRLCRTETRRRVDS